jgi:hypothetical protein
MNTLDYICRPYIHQRLRRLTYQFTSYSSVKPMNLPVVPIVYPLTFRTNVTPRSEKEGTKPPYVCPGCSNHTYGQQYGEQIQYLVKLQTRIFTK